MQDCRAGVFIDVTGLAAQRLDTDYVAGPSGSASLNAFCRTLRSNRLRHRIRVVATRPQTVQTKRLVTRMNSGAQKAFGDAGDRKEFVSGLCHGRPATVDGAANVAVLLVCDRAAWRCGNIIEVDAGHSARAGALWHTIGPTERLLPLWRACLYWWR